MGSSVQPEAGGVPTSMSLDEMEQASLETQKPDLTKVKVEGESIPEELRGKSVAEVLAHAASLKAALQTSESAREQLKLTAAGLANQFQRQPEAAPPPKEEPELTDEQIAEMMQSDQLGAIRALDQRAQKRMEKNLAQRIEPLYNGGAAQLEAAARAKYSTEFTLFGDQINEIVRNLPNPKMAMSNPQAWDDLVAFVRGKPGNIERLIEHAKSGGGNPPPTRETAQHEQAQTMGFDGSGGPRRPLTSVAQMDPIQKQIAAELGMTPEQYVHWSRV